LRFETLRDRLDPVAHNQLSSPKRLIRPQNALFSPETV
jgi:hypothetical protein